MTTLEYRSAIIELLAQLFPPPQDQERWWMIPQSNLSGDSPAQAMKKGREKEVYEVLLRMKRGH